jgi:calcineurin-like phosphoesterase family protein
MSKDIWLISDCHFGHKNIILFKDKDGNPIRLKKNGKPFQDIHEHNQYLTEKWNSVVKPQDHVWFGGDWGNFSAKRHLNGVINMIVGNHDEDFQHYQNGEEYEVQTPYKRQIGPTEFEDRLAVVKCRCPGFKKIRESRLFGPQEHHVAGLKFLQTHRPTYMGRGEMVRKWQFNVHGHIHGSTILLDTGQPDPRYYNISVEALEDYTPVHIEEVAKRLKKRL